MRGTCFLEIYSSAFQSLWLSLSAGSLLKISKYRTRYSIKSINQITLLSLKRICILQLMITSKIYGMVTTKCKWISRCIHYKNNSTGWHQCDSFNIQHSNGHRHKTPAIARCFTFYTTVSPLRRKYMEERRERVIRLSSDRTSFLQNCMVDYFGELWCR